MTILVTGGRGRVCAAVLDALIAAGVPAGELRAAGSRPDALTPPAGVETVRVDLADPTTLPAALAGVDQVVLYASADGIDGVADALRDAGVRHVVVLSSASVTEDAGALGDHHRAVEDALTARGLTTTALRPGAFATNALGWADAVRTSGRVGTAFPGSQTTPVHERDIADVAVTALLGTEVRGPIPLTGPESLSFADQIGILGREVGRDVEVVEVTPDQAREQFGGAPPAVVDALLTLWAASDGVPQPVHDVSRITGRPGRTFAQWAHDHRDAFVA